MSDSGYSVEELAAEAGVTRRTIYYYVSQGLLPGPATEGRGSRYGAGHLNRLRLIRELQRQHLPLAEIRQRLERLSDAEVADLVAAGAARPEPAGTAYDYIQAVLAGTGRAAAWSAQARAAMPVPSVPPPTPAAPAPAAAPSPAVIQPPASPRGVSPPAAATPPPVTRHGVGEERGRYGAEESVAARSQWERIALAPDIELHVRRPLSRFQNRAVDRLVAEARRILEEDPS